MGQTTSSLQVMWNEPSVGVYTKFLIGLQGMGGSVSDFVKGTTLRKSFDSLEAGKSYTVEIITVADDMQSEKAAVLGHTSK